MKELKEELIKLTLEYVRLKSMCNYDAREVLVRMNEIRTTFNSLKKMKL